MNERTVNTEIQLQELRIFEAVPGNNLLIKADSPRFTIMAASENFLNITEKSKDDLIGKGIFEGFPPNPDSPQDIEALIASFHEVMTIKKRLTLSVQRYDFPAEGNSFVNRFWRIVNTPVLNHQGDVAFIINTGEDITHEIMAGRQEKKIKSLQKAHNLLLQAPMSIQIFKGPELIIELANELTLKMWDRDESAIGKPFLEVLPELKGEGYELLMAEVIETGIAKKFYEIPIMLNKGGKEELGYYNFIYQPYYEEDQTKATGVLVFSNEVTEQVITREKIKESELRLDMAIEIAELGVYNVDLKSGTVTYTRQLMDWLGVKDQNLPMTELLARIHPDDHPMVIEHINHPYTKNSRGRHNIIFRIIEPENGQMQYLNSVGQVQFENDNPVSIIGVMRNVTEEVLARQKIDEVVAKRTQELADVNYALQQNNLELEQFAYVAAHDLQEPLRTISNFVGLFVKKYGSLNPDAEIYTRFISNATQRLQNLIKDLLDYSTIKSDVPFDSVELNEMVNQVVKEMNPVIKANHASIISNDLPVVNGNAIELKRVFHHLLSNAIKFHKENSSPQIVITAQESAEAYSIAVQDNGIGIEKPYLEKLFIIFQRLHNPQKYSGTGIGLAICKKIVNLHGGTIWVESEPGQGTTFYFTLPKVTVNQHKKANI